MFDLSGVVPPLRITGLTNEVAYKIVMYAVNDVGISVRSDAAAVMPIYRIPSVPVVGAITTTTTGASVVFTPSLPNGGLITSYYYSLDDGEWVAQSSLLKSPLKLTGLTTKTTYTFALKSVNELGDSPVSVPKTFITK